MAKRQLKEGDPVAVIGRVVKTMTDELGRVRVTVEFKGSGHRETTFDPYVLPITEAQYDEALPPPMVSRR